MISDCSRDGSIYYYCDQVLQEKDGSIIYQTKAFKPKDHFLQKVLETIKEQRLHRKFEPWRKYIRNGLELLATQEADYNRPPPETDRYRKTFLFLIYDNILLSILLPYCCKFCK